jgi:hypothetical protein
MPREVDGAHAAEREHAVDPIPAVDGRPDAGSRALARSIIGCSLDVRHPLRALAYRTTRRPDRVAALHVAATHPPALASLQGCQPCRSGKPFWLAESEAWHVSVATAGGIVFHRATLLFAAAHSSGRAPLVVEHMSATYC